MHTKGTSVKPGEDVENEQERRQVHVNLSSHFLLFFRRHRWIETVHVLHQGIRLRRLLHMDSIRQFPRDVCHGKGGSVPVVSVVRNKSRGAKGGRGKVPVF